MKKILPLKLKIARHKAGLSMDELVSRMGEAAVSKMTISKIERGLLKASPRTLHAIADACNVPVSFFCMPDISLSPMCFRYEKDMPSKRARQIEAEVIAKIEECFAKEQMVSSSASITNPLQDIVVRTYADAEDAAQRLRQYMLIGTHPIHSVYEMLQELGVMVIDIDADSTELLGTSTIINGTQPVVIVNIRSCTTTERKRFTALHELAHLFLTIQPLSEEQFLRDMPGTSLKLPTVERLCHWFANALLICPSSLERRLGAPRTELCMKELISIRNMYGISVAATVHRAHDLGIIPDDTYNHLYDDYINKNRLEEGWGSYPIMEKADRYELLEERIMMEMGELRENN
ncbi:MAG: XRE family transcriptional regulator [Bacteroidaceae bacterium]|nr:XRE family transcriptional regulator [Bacteroidaceae bacterium]